MDAPIGTAAQLRGGTNTFRRRGRHFLRQAVPHAWKRVSLCINAVERRSEIGVFVFLQRRLILRRLARKIATHAALKKLGKPLEWRDGRGYAPNALYINRFSALLGQQFGHFLTPLDVRQPCAEIVAKRIDVFCRRHNILQNLLFFNARLKVLFHQCQINP